MCVDALEEKLHSLMRRRIDLYENALVNYAVRLDSVSPLKVLARGYAIVKNDVLEPVKTAHKINEGENVTVVMRDGTLSCICEKITYEENCPVN